MSVTDIVPVAAPMALVLAIEELGTEKGEPGSNDTCSTGNNILPGGLWQSGAEWVETEKFSVMTW